MANTIQTSEIFESYLDKWVNNDTVIPVAYYATLEDNDVSMSNPNPYFTNAGFDSYLNTECLSTDENDSLWGRCSDKVCAKDHSGFLTRIFCRSRFGGDLGYQYMGWENKVDLHGLHISASYLPFDLFHVFPTLDAQLNIMFGNTGVLGGVGSGIHTFLRRDIDLYGKFMFDAQYGLVPDNGNKDWSFDAVMGVEYSGLYFEGFLPITGSGMMPSYGFSVGAIIDFGSSSLETTDRL